MHPGPTIKLHVAAPLRVYCGGARELSVSAQTIGDLLNALEEHHHAFYRNVCDETGKVRRHLNVFVNSDNMRELNGIGTTLKAGDVVTFLPAVSGGQK